MSPWMKERAVPQLKSSRSRRPHRRTATVAVGLTCAILGTAAAPQPAFAGHCSGTLAPVPGRQDTGKYAFSCDTAVEDLYTVTAVTASVAHGSAAVYTLPDGLVISPGGADVVNGTVTPTDEVAILDVVKPEVKVLSQKLSSPRLKFASALLGDGTVMVAAGVAGNYPASYGCQSNTFPTTKAVDVVDGTAGTVAPFPALNDANMELVAATLLDGSILIGGGAPCGGAGAYPYVYFLQSVPPPN